MDFIDDRNVSNCVEPRRAGDAKDDDAYATAIENFVGTLPVPLGLAGPLPIDGRHARGAFTVPLATTEAALVASYNRGCRAIALSGGCAAAVLDDRMSRAPGFAFATIAQALRFADWIREALPALRAAAERTSRYARLLEIETAIEGNHVYLRCAYATGEAAGQNMVTLATEALVAHAVAFTPMQPTDYFHEANFSSDKKASAQSLLGARGKLVTAEVILPGTVACKLLHATPKRMLDYWRFGSIGAAPSGALGVQGHYANGLAALYLATGQDVACVANQRLESRALNPQNMAICMPASRCERDRRHRRRRHDAARAACRPRATLR